MRRLYFFLCVVLLGATLFLFAIAYKLKPIHRKRQAAHLRSSTVCNCIKELTAYIDQQTPYNTLIMPSKESLRSNCIRLSPDRSITASYYIPIDQNGKALNPVKYTAEIRQINNNIYIHSFKAVKRR